MKMFADGVASIASAGSGAIEVLTALVELMKEMPSDIRTSLTMASDVEPVEGGENSILGSALSKITETGKTLLSGQKTDSIISQSENAASNMINNVANATESSADGVAQMVEPWETDMSMRFGKLKDGFESFMGRNL